MMWYWYILSGLFSLMVWISYDEAHVSKLQRYSLALLYLVLCVVSFLMAIEFEPLLRWVGRL